MIKKLNHLIVTVFGIGHIPFAPGTFGSLFGLGLGSLLLIISSPFNLWIAIGVTFLLSIFFIPLYLQSHPGKKDPSEIVIDEVGGQLIALISCQSVFEIILAFILFRVFDIWKPWPVSWADQLEGSLTKNTTGIILDDILAGAYTLLLLAICKLFPLFF